MIPKNRIPTHPGEVLREEFMVPLEIGTSRLAELLGVHPPAISEIINRRRGISAEMAWKLARLFGTSPEFWAALQSNYDLASKRNAADDIKPLRRTG